MTTLEGICPKSVILFFILIIFSEGCCITRVESGFSHERSEKRGDINRSIGWCY